jgi:acyl carrier protein
MVEHNFKARKMTSQIVGNEDVISAIWTAKIVADPGKLRTDVKLTDQGIDSLGVFNLLLVLDEKYELQIPDADADALSTIDEIVAYLNTRLGSR